ncbi:MAG: class I SAM-dependent methyltransferase [Burkholderiales bacterium]
MKNRAQWNPSKFELHRGRWRGARDARELGIGSRLISDLVAALYQAHLPAHARGALLDLGCGKAPLYGAYAAHVDEVTCVDWAPGEYIDLSCDLSQPLPFDDARFDAIILSDVLEHMPEPELVWREMTRVLRPGGKLVMNVPFYYSVHAHPHDYYRYTNFALERFVKINGLNLVCLLPVGGLVEIMADLFAKAFSKLPLIGLPLAMVTQAVVGAFGRTPIGARVSSRHFPFGYFMIAQRPSALLP